MMKLHSKQKKLINISFQVDCPKVKADSLSHVICPEAGIGRGLIAKRVKETRTKQ